ncbi:[NiFe]-hydrogenase assembly chaperone HybE [Endothiovibrio diazotrophicus]
MIDPTSASTALEQAFERIWREKMEGLPLLNPFLKVEAVGFQPWGERIVGVMITPWFMNLMLLPGAGDDWPELAIGDKQTLRLPEKSYELTLNEFDGVGRCLCFALHSPMQAFENQSVAATVANAFMEVLMTEKEEHQPSEEELRLNRFLEGEEMADILAEEQAAAAAKRCHRDDLAESTLSRRDLLRGSVGGE